jgi:AcrR family transcriptional regulator
VSTPRPEASPRRGRPPRTSREQVLRTALRLIDEGEPGELTMRALAEEMGMGVMTLYGYVASKEELYAAVTALVFDAAPGPSVPGEPWYEQVRTAVRELHDISRRHPNLLTIVLADPTPDAGLFRRRERVLTALRSAGFPPQAALHALGALVSYALGFAVAQGSALARPPEHLAADPALPEIAAAGAGYAAHLEPAAFDYGLDLLIRALRAERGER